MSNNENFGKVMTVLGTIDPLEIGITSTHDHILINFEAILTEPINPKEKSMMNKKLSLENMGWIRFNWASSKDNLVYDDENLAINELNYFKNAETDK